MIKYSLVAVATAAVLFSVGCEDSECCSTGKAVVKPVTNAPRAVIKAAGFTAQELGDCKSPDSVTFNGLDSSDNEDGKNLETSKYVWKVNGSKVSSPTVTCPTAGSTKEVCLTVEDSDKKVSTNKACMTLGKKVVASSCPPLTITATGDGKTINGVTSSDASQSSTDLKGNMEYTFSHSWASCPDTTCTWNSLESTKVDGDYGTVGNPKKCIVAGSITNDATTGSHMTSNSSLTVPISVTTCGGGGYNEIKIEVKCVNSKTNAVTSTTSYFDITGG